MKQKYIDLRNKNVDIYQEDFIRFLYQFYIENGKKCNSIQDFVDGFYYKTQVINLGNQQMKQQTDRDLSNVIPMLDSYFQIQSLHDVARQGETLGTFIKIMQ